MRARAILAVCAAAALAGCNLILDPDSVKPTLPHFSGAVGASWETLADAPFTCCPGFSDYTPPGETGLHALEFAAAYRFDPVSGWTTIGPPPADLNSWPGSAWIGDSLFAMQNNSVYEYSISADAWTTPVTTGVGQTLFSQVTHDDAGNVYAVESDAPYRVIRYSSVTGNIAKLATGGFNLNVFEPRIAWDPVTKRLFIGVAYNSPELWSFDPAAPGTALRRADVPAAGGGAGTGMGDPFCGDRSGHLYAIGDTGCSGSNSVFQYDTKANTWRAIPDLPVDHGCDGACTVSHDGWLYLTPADTPGLYRIKLQ